MLFSFFTVNLPFPINFDWLRFQLKFRKRACEIANRQSTFATEFCFLGQNNEIVYVLPDGGIVNDLLL